MSGTGNTVEAANIHIETSNISMGHGNTIMSTGDMKLDGAKADSNVTISSGKLVVGSSISLQTVLKSLLFLTAMARLHLSIWVTLIGTEMSSVSSQMVVRMDI